MFAGTRPSGTPFKSTKPSATAVKEERITTKLKGLLFTTGFDLLAAKMYF